MKIKENGKQQHDIYRPTIQSGLSLHEKQAKVTTMPSPFHANKHQEKQTKHRGHRNGYEAEADRTAHIDHKTAQNVESLGKRIGTKEYPTKSYKVKGNQ